MRPSLFEYASFKGWDADRTPVRVINFALKLKLV